MPSIRKIAVGLLLMALVGGVFIAPVEGAPPPGGAPPKTSGTGSGSGKSGTPPTGATAKGGTKPKAGAKPKKKGRKRGSRATSKPTSAPAEAAATQPTGPETAAQTLRRLNGVRVSLLKDDQVALRAALEFCLAIGEAAGERATRSLDATGYQPLPGDGEAQPAPTADGIAQEPPRQRGASDVAALVSGLTKVDLGGAGSEGFEVTPRMKLTARMPGVAAWMLPTDHAILLRPESFGGTWPKRAACVIVRVRGTHATIVGGNLLESLK